MKWFYNFKIGSKLILGFFMVAMIAGIIGIIGLNGLGQMETSIKNIGLNNLPSIQALGVINEAQTAVKAAERTIFSQATSPDTYTKESGNINAAFARAQEAKIIYDSLYRTEEEDALYKQFIAAWDTWKNDVNEFLVIADEIQKTDSQNTAAINTAIEKMKEQTLTVTSKSFSTAEDILTQIIDINKIAADQENKNAIQLSERSKLQLIIIIVIGVIVAILLGIFISHIISNPIKKMVEVADKLAIGDINVNVIADTKDEIGNLAVSFDRMIENIRGQALAVERIADGDLTIDVTVRSESDLLGKKLSEMVQNNNEIMSNIVTASEQVAIGAKQVSNSSIALSQGATEQASSVEELTASLEEISSQTSLNAKNANQANELAENAKLNAAQGNDQMKEMLMAMEEINESSSNISKIIKVIDDIAFQTNILALNAAVEAARAGQHGKGFAVVAEEVRTLAARSANAAKETTDMIEGSIKKAEGGTRIAKETAVALDHIVNGIEKVAILVNDIAIASNEQASGISQVNQGIMQVSQVVQTNSATSEESAAASEELSSQAELLKESVSRFKLKQNAKSYIRLDDISPEVLTMLENMNDRKTSGVNFKEGVAEVIKTPKIKLSDSDFGKY